MKKKRRVFMIAAMVVLVILGVLVGAAGFLMAGYSMGINAQTLDEAWAWQSSHYDTSWYAGVEKQDYTVSSFDGYALHVQLLSNPAPSGRYVLISHGYSDNRYGALKYARMYLNLGFHVLIYDLRGHGENEPTFCAYSARESRDLDALIRDSRTRYPDAAVFGLHGESLGAASSIAALKYQPRVDFVVADCGFSAIAPVLQKGLEGMQIPGWLVNVASLCAKIRFGYSYDDMRPIDSLKDSTVPLLFIHGAEDDFITPDHSEAMQKAAQGYSEIHLFPGAGHAASVLTAPEEYGQYVEAFLKTIGVLPE